MPSLDVITNTFFPRNMRWSSLFARKARVNTERVPPGHPIILVKSDKLNIAAVSVRRSTNSYIWDKEKVSCGVLFLLYVNDIHHCSNKLKFLLFADNNVVYPVKNLKTLDSIVNTALHNLFNWRTSNKLKKSNFVIFRLHQKKLLITDLYLW